MCEGDYIYCYINMLLDQEGVYDEEGINLSFDEDEFIKRSESAVEDI